jgi:hypothetical protein
MLARIVGVAMLVAAAGSLVTAAGAQERVAPGYFDIGLGVADAEADNATIAIGLRAEKLLKSMPSLGNGVLGVMAGVTGSSYQFGLGHAWYFYPVSVAATYHFTPGNGRFDPFVALGAGYRFADCAVYPYQFPDCEAEDNEAFGVARIGAKLFTSERVGLWIDGGLGSSYVSAGLVVRLK